MPKVYVINNMNHSFHKAAKYGTIHYVTKGKVPIFKTDVVKNMLRKGLESFNIKEDYLLLSGPSILCILATWIVMNGKDPVKVLVFDAKEQNYVVRHLTL